MKRLFRLTLVIISLLFCGACSDQSPQKQLERNHYRPTVEDFLRAAGQGDSGNVALFGGAGVPVNAADARGRTALMEAARHGHTETVRQLLKAGADLNQQDQNNRDALIESAAEGHAGLAQVLLSQGANPANRDKAGWTALTIAAYNGHVDALKIFSSQAPKPLLNDALLLASSQGSLAAVGHLLDAGADPETKSPGNMTPLMIAAQKGNKNLVSLLLSRKANPLQTGKNGAQAVHFAEAAGREDIVNLLGNREENKNIKPLAALHGSVIRSRNPQVGFLSTFRVGDYQEFSIPISLSEVVGDHAVLRRTDSDGRVTDLKLVQGQTIPGTSFRLEQIETPRSRPDGVAAAVRVRVEDVNSGARHLLVKTNSSRPQDAFAILVSDSSQFRYLVKAGDVFTTVNSMETQISYEVLEIGPEQISVQDLASHQTLNIMGKLEKKEK